MPEPSYYGTIMVAIPTQDAVSGIFVQNPIHPELKGEAVPMFRTFKSLTVLFLLASFMLGCGKSSKDGSGFQHDEAQTLFIEAIRARPTDKEKALDLLNQSIDSKPTYNAHFHRAWLYALKNDDAKANEDIKAGLALEPDSTDLKWLEGEMKKAADKRKLDMPPATTK